MRKSCTILRNDSGMVSEERKKQMQEKKKSNIRKGFNNINNNPFSFARTYARKESLVEILKARFYEPSIVGDLEAAVDYAMEKTGCPESYRELWMDLCLVLGINTFTDLADMVVSRTNQEDVRSPAALFYSKARLLANAKMKGLQK